MILKDIFPNVMNLTEAFNASFDFIEWEKFNDSMIAKAKIGDDEFRLYIEPSTFSFDGSQKIWVNVAFARVINGSVTQELINTGSNQSVQIGSIVNALRKKISELSKNFTIDAIVLIVEAGQEKRISLYKKILLSKIYGLRPWQYRFSINWFGGTALVATEKLLSSDEREALEKEITSRRKMIDYRVE